MNRIGLICLVAVCSIATIDLLVQPNQLASQTASSSQPPKVTIESLVRDIACPIQDHRAQATAFDLQRALDRARHGYPLIIQTKDGELYIPISDSMPDTDQREKLMPLVGKYVRAQGTVFERSGTHAIVISEIKEIKDVHLKTDAK